MKMMVVGQENVGKSTLIQQILKGWTLHHTTNEPELEKEKDKDRDIRLSPRSIAKKVQKRKASASPKLSKKNKTKEVNVCLK